MLAMKINILKIKSGRNNNVRESPLRILGFTCKSVSLDFRMKKKLIRKKTKGSNKNSMLINDLNTLNLTPFTNHQHIAGGFIY